MLNKINDQKFHTIVESICYWLGYQQKIGRQHLIHEASLRYPIADTLTSKWNKINHLVLEKVHPNFKSKRFDLVVYDSKVDIPNDEKDDSNLKEAYEFKIANSETGKHESDEHQRIFDDVVRLGYYHMWNKKDCYFLMCGKYEDFKAYFIGQKAQIQTLNNGKNVIASNIKQQKSNNKPLTVWKPDGLYKNWFGFKNGEIKKITFSCPTNSNPDDWGLPSFQKRYEFKKNSNLKFVDITIQTTCLAITYPDLEKNRTHAAGIWKIESI